MSNKYEVLFDECYARMKDTLLRQVISGYKILDLGINNANLESFLDEQGIRAEVIGVDNDAEALKAIPVLRNVTVLPVCADANDYLESFSGTVDMVLLSATLHEINDYRDQQMYLEWLFLHLDKILSAGGRLVVGDYYFPKHVTDDEVERFKEYQLEAIGHADNREKFVPSVLLKEVAEECGYHLVSFIDTRAVKELDRRYYVIVLEKV